MCGGGIVACDHYDPDTGFIALLYRFFDPRADRVCKPDESEELKGEGVLLTREGGPGKHGFCHPEDPEPFGGHVVDALPQVLHSIIAQMTDVRDRLGCPFGGDDIVPAVR